MAPNKNIDRSYDQCSYRLCGESPETMGARLRACSRCKVMHYCSKECQKNDWPNHQKACKEMAHERDIVNAQFNGECVYQYFCRWIQRHWPTLIDALLAILDISTNPTAHEKRALQVMVSYKGGNAGSTDVASCMEVQMVSPFDLERAIRNEPARYEPLLAYRKRLGEDVKRVRPSTYDAGIIFIALVTPEGECITVRGLPVTFETSEALKPVPKGWQHAIMAKLSCGIVGLDVDVLAA